MSTLQIGILRHREFKLLVQEYSASWCFELRSESEPRPNKLLGLRPQHLTTVQIIMIAANIYIALTICQSLFKIHTNFSYAHSIMSSVHLCY